MVIMCIKHLEQYCVYDKQFLYTQYVIFITILYTKITV